MADNNATAGDLQICLDCYMLKEAFNKENERVHAK